MKSYTIADLNQGVGVFDHVMRRASEYPSSHTAMPAPVAIGVIAAALQSGLNADEISEVIATYFDEDSAELLAAVREMYSGHDERLHFWNEKAKSPKRISRSLDYYVRPNWHIDRPYNPATGAR
jgi:hypothetical protein